MKKIIKLSMITALVLGVSNASENIQESITNGKVNGELKALYSSSNFLGKTETDNIFIVGGSLGYITGDYYGLSSGFTFQASSRVSESNKNNVFANDYNASGAVLSEAYLTYKISNTNLKAGRQFIYTPLISTAIDGKSSQRVIKDSFEAYTLTNTDIPNTTLVAGYVDKYQASTNGLKDEGEFNDFQDGAYTLYMKNNSIDNLTVQAQYLKVNGVIDNTDINNFYVDAEYKIDGTILSAQYLSSKDESQVSNAEDGEAFGIKIQGGFANLGYLLAYSKSTKNGEVNLGAGAGTLDTLYTAMPVNGGGVPARPNTDTIVGALILPVAGVTTIAYAGRSYRKVGLGDVDALGAMAIYPVNKSLMIKANYEYVSSENVIPQAGIVDKRTDVARLYINYKF